MNKTKINIIYVFVFVLAIFCVGKVSLISADTGCSVTCTGACTVHSGGCDDSVAGCGYGQTPPETGAWCCPYKSVCSCYSHDCGGCTPECQPGESTTVSGPLCQTSVSTCKGSDGCESCNFKGDMCYVPETNTSFIQSNGSTSGPTSIKIIVDGAEYQLSTDPNNPTKIKLPAVNSTNVQVKVPTFTAATTARGAGYNFQADNYGTNDEWKGWVSCSGTAGEDFCIDGGTTETSNVITFKPTTQTVGNVLKEGAEGKISASYYTVNKCDDNKKSSLAIEGYYIVDTQPITNQINIIPKSYNNCTPTSYTGINANNPLNITTTINYSNPNDLSGIMIWLSKDTSVPTITQISDLPNSSYYEVSSERYCPTQTTLLSDLCIASQTTLSCPKGYTKTYTSSGITCTKGGSLLTIACPNGNYWTSRLCCPNNTTYNTSTKRCESKTIYTSSSANDIPVMITKNGTTWSSPNIYSFGLDSRWHKLGDDATFTVAGNKAVKVSIKNITQNTDNVSIDFSLQFLTTASDNIQGAYNLYALALDQYMINYSAPNGATVDQSRIKNYFQWAFDLINPTTTEPSQSVKDQSNLNFTWGTSDSLSGINKVLINAYKTGGTVSDQLELLSQGFRTVIIGGRLVRIPTIISKGRINLNSLPADDQIGLYNDTNAWTFTNSTGEQDTINIGNNEGGKISLYVTAYDNACNSSAKTTDVDLNPWFTTYGGLVYSKGNINTRVKSVSSINWTFKNTALTKDTLDLGTELLATRNQAITTLVHSNLGGVRAFLVYDSNNTKNRYESLKSKFKDQSGLASFTWVPNQKKTSETCTGTAQNCYTYSTGDITISSGYICDKNTLFISDGNITINPDITSDSSKLSGCIFLAKNNIYIGAGTYKSTSTIGYDYIEGEFIADNQIIFTIADQEQASGIRDGIEVSGSLIAFGSNITNEPAIDIQRNLKLLNQSNPTLVQSYNPKYGAISQIFFGTDVPVYSQEIGFKAF